LCLRPGLASVNLADRQSVSSAIAKTNMKLMAAALANDFIV